MAYRKKEAKCFLKELRVKTLSLLIVGLLTQSAIAATSFSRLPKVVRDLHVALNGQDCELTESADNQIETFSLGRDKSLILVPCTGGAYNITSLGYILQDKVVTPLTILTVQVDEHKGQYIEPTTALPNASFNPQTGILSTMFKGRGLGDCGTLSKTEIFASEWGGIGVKTVEIRSQMACNEEFDKEWPLVFKQ